MMKFSVNEKGVALLELAIVLNLIVIFTTGIIAGSLILRDAKQASDSIRHAGRTASALSFDGVRFATLCDNTQIDTETCNVVNSSQNYTTDDTDLIDASMAYACQALVDAGLDEEEWNVSSEILTDLREDGTVFTGIELTATRIAPAECIICWKNFYPAAYVVSGTFILERLPCP